MLGCRGELTSVPTRQVPVHDAVATAHEPSTAWFSLRCCSDSCVAISTILAGIRTAMCGGGGGGGGGGEGGGGVGVGAVSSCTPCAGMVCMLLDACRTETGLSAFNVDGDLGSQWVLLSNLKSSSQRPTTGSLLVLSAGM